MKLISLLLFSALLFTAFPIQAHSEWSSDRGFYVQEIDDQQNQYDSEQRFYNTYTQRRRY